MGTIISFVLTYIAFFKRELGLSQKYVMSIIITKRKKESFLRKDVGL